MIISMLLLIVLQGLWLHSEYKGASDDFKRETNLLFRSTIHHLADSLFFSQMDPATGDDLENERFSTANNDSTRLSSIQVRRIGSQNDSTGIKSSSIIIQGNRPDQDSIVLHDTVVHSSGSMRFIFNRFAREITPERMTVHFHNTLDPQYQQLEVSVIEKEVDWFQRPRARQPQQRRDSLPYTTSYVPVGMNKVYAASFQGVRGFLLQQLLPQIGFSVFITGLILLSFIMVSRSLRNQQRLIEQKNNFIGNMTHELKTPVATVGVALEAMQNFDVMHDPEKARQYIDMARHELERLSLMTDKILKTSVFDAEKEICDNLGRVDMALVVEKVMASFELVAQNTNTAMIFTRSANNIIQGHEEHLTQMVYNLADNALKYGSQGPSINFHLEEKPQHLILKVSDQGPGIPEMHQQKVFEKFYRVPSGNIHTVKGYGLGLNYVRAVVRGHKGKIHLKSYPGQGASFEIRLPKSI